MRTALVVLVGTLLRSLASAQAVQVLHEFSSAPPLLPIGGVVSTADGLYGITVQSGNGGILYRIAPGGAIAVVHRFGESEFPDGHLLRGQDGALYGTTSARGAGGNGTVFRVDPTNGRLRVLHAFAGAQAGRNPVGALTQTADGWIYGVTADGGALSGGTLYRVHPTTGESTTLHHFGIDAATGVHPHAGVIVGTDGALYGSTSTLFRFDPATGVMTGLPGLTSTDLTSDASLTLTRDGQLYGVMAAQGTNAIFKVGPGGVVAAVCVFQPSNGVDGWHPLSTLVEAADGSLLGTTLFGPGAQGDEGTIFRVERLPGGGHSLVQLAVFQSTGAGAEPRGDLTIGQDGLVYGTLAEGGPAGGGSVYRFDPLAPGPSISVEVVHALGEPSASPSFPRSALTVSGAWIYGVTAAGGSGRGVVYRISPASGGVTVTANVPGVPASMAANGALAPGPDGKLYGVTVGGPAGQSYAAIFSVDPETGAVTGSTVVSDMLGELTLRAPVFYALVDHFDRVDLVRYDPASNTLASVTTIFTGSTGFGGPSHLVAASDGWLYYVVTYNRSSRFSEPHLMRVNPLSPMPVPEQVALPTVRPGSDYEALRLSEDGRVLVLVHAAGSTPFLPKTTRLDVLELATGAARTTCEFGVLGSDQSPMGIDAAGQVAVLTSAGGPALLQCDIATGTVMRSPLLVDLAASGPLTLGHDGLLYGTAAGGTLGGGSIFRVAPLGDLPVIDTDGDGLDNTWETRFGLGPSLAAGEDGAGGDPDGDGRTNAEEYAAGTHPRGTTTRYLAEGATGSFFSTRIDFVNPTAEPALVLVRFLTDTGARISRTLWLPALSPAAIEVGDVPGLASANMSTIIEADRRIVVERTMRWGSGGYGSHGASAVDAPASSWILAEGSTSGDFALFYLLQNPTEVPITATIRYLRPFGQAVITRTYRLPPLSRTTIAVDAEGPELASTDVSAVITATAPIIVERAMYLTRGTQPFAAGHASAGVTAPALEWFLAEGATGPFFDLFILIANPNAETADVRVDYLLAGGGVLSTTVTVAGNSRHTIWVDDEELPRGSGLKPLANAPVSAIVRSTNQVPIVVERTMWWPGPELSSMFWYEAHNSPGATASALRWALGGAEVGGADSAETYVLIANPAASPGRVILTASFVDGGSATRSYDVPARSRTSVPLGVDLPNALGRGPFGVVVESIGAEPVPIVVEHATYASPGGVTWASGTNALATPIP